jgi:hypothetical protein
VKAKTIDLTDIAKIQDRLRTSPSRPKTRVRYIKAIELLASEIHAMRSNGYGWSDIAAVLTESGLEVSATTIRTYLGRVTSEPSRPRQGHPRDVANPSALTSQAPSSQNPDHRPRLRSAMHPRESKGYRRHRLRPDRRPSTRASRRRRSVESSGFGYDAAWIVRRASRHTRSLNRSDASSTVFRPAASTSPSPDRSPHFSREFESRVN